MTDLAWIHKLGKHKVFKSHNMRYDVQAIVLYLFQYTNKHNFVTGLVLSQQMSLVSTLGCNIHATVCKQEGQYMLPIRACWSKPKLVCGARELSGHETLEE